MFAPYGPIEKVNIVRGRGFGFVLFYDATHATAAKEALDGMPFGKKKIKIRYARPQTEPKLKSNIFVRGFPSVLPTSLVKGWFRRFGQFSEFRRPEGMLCCRC